MKMVKKVAGAPARQRFVVAAAAAAFIRIDVGQNRTSLESLDRTRRQPSLESFGDGKELNIYQNWNQNGNLPMLEYESFRGQNRTV